MNTILLKNEDFITSDTVKLTGYRLEHMRKVLKSQPGSLCKVGLLNGKLGKGEVLNISDGHAALKVSLDTLPPEPLDLVLVCAMQRPQTYKKVLHTAITMGVKHLVFFGSFKVEKSYWDSPVLSREIFEREAITALEQCCDTIMPSAEYHKYFKKFVDDELPRLSQNRTVYIAHPACGENFPDKPQTPALLLVGPEGGFTDYEVSRLLETGAKGGTLGSRILRTEVALPALLGKFL